MAVHIIRYPEPRWANNITTANVKGRQIEKRGNRPWNTRIKFDTYLCGLKLRIWQYTKTKKKENKFNLK